MKNIPLSKRKNNFKKVLVIIFLIFTICGMTFETNSATQQEILDYFSNNYTSADAQTIYNAIMNTGDVVSLDLLPAQYGQQYLLFELREGVDTEEFAEKIHGIMEQTLDENEYNRFFSMTSYTSTTQGNDTSEETTPEETTPEETTPEETTPEETTPEETTPEETAPENTTTEGSTLEEQQKAELKQLLINQGYDLTDSQIDTLYMWGIVTLGPTTSMGYGYVELDIVDDHIVDVVVHWESLTDMDWQTLGMEPGDVGLDGSNDFVDGAVALLGQIIDGLAGIVFYVLKLLPMIGGWLLLRIIGLVINGVDGALSGLPLDRILFNEIPLLSINFFDSVSGGGTDVELITDIRNQVAIWYVAIRNLAAIILAVMVLYVGIRMAMSSIADDKAKYKNMLFDLVVSILLLFVLHYIMIFIININDGLIAILSRAKDDVSGSSTIMDDLWDRAMTTVSFTEQIGYAFLYFMLAVMCFVFFATYVKRMITIAFLIMISPIITVTYSLDRMGDGKSQALNSWFKNFVYNILLQPFHCIIYLALVQTAMESISAENITSVIIAIMMVFFMYEAEDIIKEIFHFEGKSVANTIAQAALVTSVISLASQAASTAGAVKGYAGNMPNGTGEQPTMPNQQVQPGQQNNQSMPGNQGSTSDNPWENYANSSENYMNLDYNGPIQQPTANQLPANGSGASQQGQSGNIQSNNTSPGVNMAKNLAKQAGMGALKEMGKLAFALPFAAMGLGTGNLANASTFFQSGRNMASNIINSQEEKANVHNFATKYNDLVSSGGQNIYEGHDNEWIRKHTSDLLKGDVDVQAYEKEYYDAALKEMDRYVASGLSVDDAITQVEQNVAGIQGGYLGEATLGQRFIGLIPQVRERLANNRQNANFGENIENPDDDFSINLDNDEFENPDDDFSIRLDGDEFGNPIDPNDPNRFTSI